MKYDTPQCRPLGRFNASRASSLRRILTCIAIVAVAMLPGMALAETYHVAAGAAGANDGSSAAPFATIAQAADVAVAGDTVYVEQGEYNESVTLEHSGKENTPIIFVGQDRPQVHGVGGPGFSVSGNYVTVQGFDVSDSVFGIHVTGSNVNLLGNYVHHNRHDGIRVESAMDVHIQGGEIYDNGPGNAVGIWLAGSVYDLVVQDVDISSTGIQKTGINAYEAGESNGIILRNVNIHDHPEYGASLMAESPGELTDIRIIGCRFDHNGFGAVHAIGDMRYRLGNVLIQRATRSIVEKSVFSNGPGWGMDCYTSDRLVIRNNLFLNNADSGDPAVGPGIGLEVNAGQDNLILHNLFFGNSIGLFTSYIDSGGVWPPGPAFDVVQNNIFWGNDEDLQVTTEDNPPLTVLQGANLMDVDPQFVDAAGLDFHLATGSPAIDAGVDTGVDDDFDGNHRPQGAAPDSGPFEFQPHE